MKYVFEKVRTEDVPLNFRLYTADPELTAVYQNIMNNTDENTWLKITGITNDKELTRLQNAIRNRDKKEHGSRMLTVRTHRDTANGVFELYARKITQETE